MGEGVLRSLSCQRAFSSRVCCCPSANRLKKTQKTQMNSQIEEKKTQILNLRWLEKNCPSGRASCWSGVSRVLPNICLLTTHKSMNYLIAHIYFFIALPVAARFLKTPFKVLNFSSECLPCGFLLIKPNKEGFPAAPTSYGAGVELLQFQFDQIMKSHNLRCNLRNIFLPLLFFFFKKKGFHLFYYLCQSQSRHWWSSGDDGGSEDMCKDIGLNGWLKKTERVGYRRRWN